MAECHRCPYASLTNRTYGATIHCTLEPTNMDVTYFCLRKHKDENNELCPLVNRNTRWAKAGLTLCKEEQKMKKVTVADCLELQKLFEKYCETAEQHEFIKLILIQSRMDKYISRLQQVGKIENQKEANAMFRVVLGAIGKDFSDYKEVLE